MATSRPVRIARPGRRPPTVPPPGGPVGGETSATRSGGGPSERRANGGGSRRATRVTALYLVALAALYLGFVLYDRTAPGGAASPEANGLLLLTGIFAAFAILGAVYTLHPAPRAIEVEADHVTIVGRWGRRRVLPPLEALSLRVVRRYPAGWFSDTPVEQVELWGKDVSLRTYLVDADLFRGATAPNAAR